MKIIEKFFRETRLLVDKTGLKEGRVIKLSPGYHTRNPYFVLITYYNPEAGHGEVKMTTMIPFRHSLDWTVGQNWDYHYRRIMEISDDIEKVRNQKLY